MSSCGAPGEDSGLAPTMARTPGCRSDRPQSSHVTNLPHRRAKPPLLRLCRTVVVFPLLMDGGVFGKRFFSLEQKEKQRG
jgi:hypothetical protein